jgi:membrane associated rhomboid family serine protease
MTHASVGLRCPECAGQRSRVTRPRAGAVATRMPVVTYVLIAANVVMFVLTTNLNELNTGFGFSSASPINSLGYRLALWGPAVANGDYWRLVTAAFVHDGLLHIGFNMYALWVLGSVFEQAVGPVRLLAVYFVSLLAGSFGALYLTPNSPTVGASGAIFGLMGALFVLERQRGISSIMGGIGVWIVVNLAFTFSAGGAISIGGHIGGLIGGGLAGFALSGYGRGHMAYGKVTPAVALGLIAIAVGSVIGGIHVA